MPSEKLLIREFYEELFRFRFEHFESNNTAAKQLGISPSRFTEASSGYRGAGRYPRPRTHTLDACIEGGDELLREKAETLRAFYLFPTRKKTKAEARVREAARTERAKALDSRMEGVTRRAFCVGVAGTAGQATLCGGGADTAPQPQTTTVTGRVWLCFPSHGCIVVQPDRTDASEIRIWLRLRAERYGDRADRELRRLVPEGNRVTVILGWRADIDMLAPWQPREVISANGERVAVWPPEETLHHRVDMSKAEKIAARRENRERSERYRASLPPGGYV